MFLSDTLNASFDDAVRRCKLGGEEMFLVRLSRQNPVDLTSMTHGFEAFDLDNNPQPLDPVPLIEAPIRAVKYALLGRHVVVEAYPSSCDVTSGCLFADSRFEALHQFKQLEAGSKDLDDATFTVYRVLFERDHTITTEHNEMILRRMMQEDLERLHPWWLQCDAPPVRLQVLALRYMLGAGLNMSDTFIDAALISIMACTLFDDVVASVNDRMRHHHMDSVQFNVDDVAFYRTFGHLVESIHDLTCLLGMRHAADMWPYLDEYPNSSSNAFVFLYVLSYVSSPVDIADFDKLFAFTTRSRDERDALSADMYVAFLNVRDATVHKDIVNEELETVLIPLSEE